MRKFSSNYKGLDKWHAACFHFPDCSTRVLKRLVYGISILCISVFCALPTYAAEKINNVKIKFDVEDYDEYGEPDLIAEVPENKRYSVSEIMSYEDYLSNSNLSRSSANIENMYVVRLSADDDAVFYLKKKDDVKISGLGAEYIRAARKDQGSTLDVAVRLNNLDEKTGSIESISWDKTGKAFWDASYNAYEYQLRLIGPKKNTLVSTGGTSYDFRPLMLEEGEYSISIRPVSITGNKGSSTESTFSVTAEQAQENKKIFKVEKEYIYQEGEEKGPSSENVQYLNTGWQKADDGRYWYRNQDGTYPQTNWICDSGTWYFFNSDGYMVTNQFVEWKGKDYYFGRDGKMYSDSVAPDRRKADVDGVLKGKRSKNHEYNFLNMREDTSMYGPAFDSKKETQS